MIALVVHIDDVDTKDAARGTGREGQRPQLGLLFAAINYEVEMILAAEAFPGLVVFGERLL